jgi:hypothetical protein
VNQSIIEMRLAASAFGVICRRKIDFIEISETKIRAIGVISDC